MEALFGTVLDWVQSHPYWAGLAVFAIAFAESLAIVGIIVPGVVIMFGIGALVAAGGADFWSICAWAVAGAVAGDGLSYWLGRHYRHSLRSTWPFNRFPRTLEQGEQFFIKYGGLSVVLGRFFGPGRAAVPLVAGMLDMRPAAFLLANVGSALLWAPAYLLPGVVFGASLELASEVAWRLVMLLLLLLGLLWFSGWLAHRVFLRLQPHASELVARLLRLGGRYAGVRRMAEAMANPTHPEARGLAAFGGLLVLASATLAVLSTLLADMLPWATLDQLAAGTFASLRTEGADRFMAAGAAAGQPLAIAVLGGLAAATLAAARRQIALLHWLGGLAGAAVALALLALVTEGPQPGSLIPDAGVLAAGVLFGLLAVLLAPAVPEGLRWSVYAVGIMLVSLTLFARLYLGLTTLGGVVTGALLGLTWVAGVGVGYRTHALDEPLSRLVAGTLGGVAVAALLALAVAAPAVHAPAGADESDPVDLPDWQGQGWRRPPLLRADLRATRFLPLNLQYAGELAWLDQRLSAAGWTAVAPQTATQLLRLLSPALPLDQLPLLPHVHDGRHEQAAWILNQGDTRLVLRLWPSAFRVPDLGTLWLGEVSRQEKRTRFDLLGYATTVPDYPAALRQLAQQLGQVVLVEGPHGPVLLLSAAPAPGVHPSAAAGGAAPPGDPAPAPP